MKIARFLKFTLCFTMFGILTLSANSVLAQSQVPKKISIQGHVSGVADNNYDVQVIVKHAAAQVGALSAESVQFNQGFFQLVIDLDNAAQNPAAPASDNMTLDEFASTDLRYDIVIDVDNDGFGDADDEEFSNVSVSSVPTAIFAQKATHAEFADSANIAQDAASIGGQPILDMSGSAPADGEALIWQASPGRWIAGAAGGGGGDVSFGAISDNDIPMKSSGTIISSGMTYSGGNIGIGTSPSEKLHVAGTVKASGLQVSSYAFPASDGTNGQALITDGGGVLSWGNMTPAPSSINGSHITAGTVANSNLAPNAVDSVKINDGTVAEHDLKISNAPTSNFLLSWNGSEMEWVTSPPPGVNSIGTSEIADSTVSPDDLNTGSAATSGKFLSYTGSQMDWVAAPAPGAGSITSTELAPNAVDSAKIVNGSIASTDLDYESSPSGHVLQSNGASVVWAALPGLSASSVTSTEIANLTIAADDIGADAVTTAKIQNSAVTNSKLAANAVQAANINNGSVTLSKMAGNSVDSSKIVDGSVGSADIDDESAAAGHVLQSDGAGNVIWGAVPSSAPAANSIDSSHVIDNTIGPADLAIFMKAPHVTDDNETIAIGQNAGANVSAARQNVFLGKNAGQNVTTGTANIALGYNAGDSGTIGQRNIAIGQDSGALLTSGSDNISIGMNAGTSLAGDLNSIAIGRDAEAGSYGIALGKDASAAAGEFAVSLDNTGINQLVLDGTGHLEVSSLTTNATINTQSLMAAVDITTPQINAAELRGALVQGTFVTSGPTHTVDPNANQATVYINNATGSATYTLPDPALYRGLELTFIHMTAGQILTLSSHDASAIIDGAAGKTMGGGATTRVVWKLIAVGGSGLTDQWIITTQDASGS